LNRPKPLTLEVPGGFASVNGPGVNPGALLDPVILDTLKLEALTLRAADDPSVNRYRLPPLVSDWKITLALVELFKVTVTFTYGPVQHPEIALLPVSRVMRRAEAVRAPSVNNPATITVSMIKVSRVLFSFISSCAFQSLCCLVIEQLKCHSLCN